MRQRAEMDFEAQLVADRLSHQRRDIDARDAPAQFRHAAEIAAAAAAEVEQPAGAVPGEASTAAPGRGGPTIGSRIAREVGSRGPRRGVGTIAAGVKGSDRLGRGAWIGISEPAVAALHDREAEARSRNGGVVGGFGAKFGIVAAAEQAGRLFPGQWRPKVGFGLNDGTIGDHGGPSVSRARGERGRIAEERVNLVNRERTTGCDATMNRRRGFAPVRIQLRSVMSSLAWAWDDRRRAFRAR